MRVLLINNEYPPIGGGAATATAEIAKALRVSGHAPTVLTSAFRGLRGVCDEDGVIVHRVPALRRAADRSSVTEMATFLTSARLRVLAIAESAGCEGTIAFFSVPCGPLARLLWRRRRIPYVVSLRGGDVPGHVADMDRLHLLLSPTRKAVLRDAAAVVANSTSLADLAERADGVPVHVVFNGVDTAAFRPHGGKSGRPLSEPFRFLFVGRLHPHKDPGFLLDAIAVLKRRLSLPFALDVVGDGPQGRALRLQAARPDLEGLVTWHGWVDRARILERYQMADCLVNPAPREGMPNAVLEAMACGLPVLASRAPGHEDIVREGETGFTFEPGSVNAFVRLAIQLVESPELCARLGAAARRVALQSHSWNRVAERYSSLLEVARRSSGDPAAAGPLRL